MIYISVPFITYRTARFASSSADFLVRRSTARRPIGAQLAGMPIDINDTWTNLLSNHLCGASFKKTVVTIDHRDMFRLIEQNNCRPKATRWSCTLALALQEFPIPTYV